MLIFFQFRNQTKQRFWGDVVDRRVSDFTSYDLHKNTEVYNRKKSTRKSVVTSHIEMGSHTDTTAASDNCCMMHYIGRKCDVSPCSDQYTPVDVMLI